MSVVTGKKERTHLCVLGRGQEGSQQEGISDLGLECRWAVAAWRAEGGTESVPRKLGEAAVQADRADGGKAAFRTRRARKQYAQTRVRKT